MRSYAIAALFLFGCAHKPPQQTATTPVGGGVASGQAGAGNGSGSGSGCSSDNDCGARQLCIRNQCVDITAGLAECETFRVHFDFDSTEVRAEDRGALERVSRCLKAEQKMHVTIEGNADERGTDEYNLALGDKRANVVEKYLERMGVSVTQLRAVSYGKERPLCTEHDESCWSQNRRAAIRAGK